MISPLGIKILAGVAIAAALVGGFQWWIEGQRDEAREAGAAAVRADMTAKALAESQEKAKETLRRLEAQRRNQDAQDAEIARLRDAAARNAAHAERVQRDADAAASQWRARLADSPTAEDLQAAGAAIAVCADVRGRLDAAAGELAGFAGASRAAGLKCEADYDALTKP